MKGENTKRIIWLDAAKGMTICLVVFGHVLDGYNRAGNWENYQMVIGRVISTVINLFHMPLFFMISGYVFGTAYIEAGELKKQNVKYQIFNLLLLYGIFSILYAVVKIVGSPWVNSNITWKDIMLIPIKAIDLYWYFYVLIFLYLIMRIWYKQSVIKLVILSFCGCMLYSIVGIGRLGFEMTLKSVIYYAIFFLVGYAFQQNYNFMNILQKQLVAIGMVGGGGMIFLLLNKNGFLCFSELVVRIMRPIIALHISVFFVLLFYSKWRKSGIISMIGEKSLEIYTLHIFFTSGIRPVLAVLNIDNYFFAVFIGMILGVLVPLIAGYILRKLCIWKYLYSPAKVLSLGKEGR